MRREGDKILFASNAERLRFESTIELGDEEFLMKMLRVMERASKMRNKAWKTVHDKLEGQLEPDETLVYDHAAEELRVVRVDLDVYPERKKEE